MDLQFRAPSIEALQTSGAGSMLASQTSTASCGTVTVAEGDTGTGGDGGNGVDTGTGGAGGMMDGLGSTTILLLVIVAAAAAYTVTQT